MSAAMMSRPFNDVYVNEILTVSMDTTPTYVIFDVIGVVEPLAKKPAFLLKSI